jgi:hypothetical protein
MRCEVSACHRVKRPCLRDGTVASMEFFSPAREKGVQGVENSRCLIIRGREEKGWCRMEMGVTEKLLSWTKGADRVCALVGCNTGAVAQSTFKIYDRREPAMDEPRNGQVKGNLQLRCGAGVWEFVTSSAHHFATLLPAVYNYPLFALLCTMAYTLEAAANERPRAGCESIRCDAIRGTLCPQSCFAAAPASGMRSSVEVEHSSGCRSL